MLPNMLGKIFYKGTKRPMPVNLEPSRPKDPTTGKRRSKPISSATAEATRSVTSPTSFAQEIQRALAGTQVHLSPSPTTAVRVGLASFTPDQLAANVEAVVHGMIEKFVTKGWRNVRSVHIKGPNTLALPIWLARELWVEEADVLEEAEAARRAEGAAQTGKRKRKEIEQSEGKEIEAEGVKKKKKNGERKAIKEATKS
jgi:ribosome biogenesis protein UTP30